MPRTDPTDTGGLFVGRRPGTAPVRYRTLPEEGTLRRRTFDRAVALGILLTMILVNLLFWGPLPAGALWVCAQVDYKTDNVGLALVVGFAVLLAALFGSLMILKRLDQTWILVRRAAGYDQRQGVLRIVFPVTVAIGVAAFSFWFIVIHGPGSSLGPANA